MPKCQDKEYGLSRPPVRLDRRQYLPMSLAQRQYPPMSLAQRQYPTASLAQRQNPLVILAAPYSYFAQLISSNRHNGFKFWNRGLRVKKILKIVLCQEDSWEYVSEAIMSPSSGQPGSEAMSRITSLYLFFGPRFLKYQSMN